MTHPILQKLAVGTPGVVGASAEVAREIEGDPELFAVVMDGLGAEDVGIRNRAANALDRATRRDATLLQPHADALLECARANLEGATLRRLLPLLLGRLPLGLEDARRVVAYCRPRSERGLVATRSNALDALASMAALHPEIEAEILPVLEAALDDPGVSHRARARLVLERLDRQTQNRRR